MKKLGISLLLAGALWAGGIASAGEVLVEIKDYKFVPPTLTVKAGTRVKWVNAEKRTSHSVWFQEEGLAESERFFPDESWSRTFERPGTYRYTCGPHPEMLGTVVVTE
jgi:plastocyanin